MNMFMEFFLFFVSILQFLFPFAFKDTDVPVQTTEPVVQETVVPGEHVHTGGNGNCLQGSVCEICGETYGEGQHVYTVTVKPATCTEGGYTTFRCRFCLHTEEGDFTEPTNHSYESKVYPATCTEGERTVYKCKNCTNSYTETTGEPKDHDYEEKVFEANCTESERTVYKCNDCGHTYMQTTGEPIGHDYEGNAIVTLPTCTSKGYTTYTCNVCTYSYTGDEVDAVPHVFTNYTSDNNATCTSDGTKSAFCENGCNTKNTITEENTKLAHADNNDDTFCDGCGTEKIYVDYTYLQYPDAALADNVPLADFIKKADKNDNLAEYVENEGTTYNGIRTSPYFTVSVNGRVNGSQTATTTAIPVYGTPVFIGTTQKGALHSFSEIYIEEGEYAAFTIEIESKDVRINTATILPESDGETATVRNGKVTAVLSGLGTHTFLFNEETSGQQYAYTIHVRPQVDDDAIIAMLQQDPNNEVIVIEGYKMMSEINAITNDNLASKEIPAIIMHTMQNKVIYLKKGAYLVADHKYDINDASTDHNSYSESINVSGATEQYNGDRISGMGGIKRAAALNINSSQNIQVLGYGAIDLSRLDRGERRGAIISWSENVRLQGLKFINSPQWTCVLYNCKTVTIKDVDVYGYRLNSDAFDICNSSNVTVEGCFARAGDDGFVVKTLGGDWVTDTVTVRNCSAWMGKARGFGIFGETNNNISNVTFENNTVLYHDATWDYMKVPALGIVVEGSNPDNPNLGAENSGSILTNITFRNIEVCRNRASAFNAIIFNDVADFQINGLTLDNIKFEKINDMQYNNQPVKAVCTIDRFSDTSSIANVLVKDVYCGDVKVTNDNYQTYFDGDLLGHTNVTIE